MAVVRPCLSVDRGQAVATRLPARRGRLETVVGNGREIRPAVGRAVIGVARSDHDLGEVCTIGGHDAVRHKLPEALRADHGADDVLAIDGERSHVLRGGSAWLVHVRRVQGVDANAMPVNDERVAIDRRGFARDDRRLRPFAVMGSRWRDRDRCGYQERSAI
jgi:hypothetical protein